MSIPIRLHSPASPDCVLAAVREHAGEWRESAIPQHLRKQGLRQVEAEIKGSRFTLSMPAVTDVPDDIVLRCHVIPDGATGSRLEGWCGPRWKIGDAAAILAIPGLAFFFFGDRTLGLVLTGMAGLGAVGDAFTERKVGRGESEIAQYLISRLDHALTTLAPAAEPAVAGDARPSMIADAGADAARRP
jgi:hypothetical protein